jgi:hypothetical protein
MKPSYPEFTPTDADQRLDGCIEQLSGSLHGFRSLADDFPLRIPHPLGCRATSTVAKFASDRHIQPSLRLAGSDCETDPLASFARSEAPRNAAQASAYSKVFTDAEISGRQQSGMNCRQGMLPAKPTRFTVPPRGYRLSDVKAPLMRVESLVNEWQVVTVIAEDDGVCFKLTDLDARQNITLRVSLIRSSLVAVAPGRITAWEFTGRQLVCSFYCEAIKLVNLNIRTGVAHLYKRGTHGFGKQLNIHCVIPADTNLRGRFLFVARQLSPRELLSTHGIKVGNLLHFYGFAHFEPLGAAKVKDVYKDSIIVGITTIYNPFYVGIYTRNAGGVIFFNSPLIHANNYKVRHERYRTLPSDSMDLNTVSNTTVNDDAFELDTVWTALCVELRRELDVVSLTNNGSSPENPLRNTPTCKNTKP